MSSVFSLVVLLLVALVLTTAVFAQNSRSCHNSVGNAVSIASTTFNDGIEVNLTASCVVELVAVTAPWIRFYSASLQGGGRTDTSGATIKITGFTAQLSATRTMHSAVITIDADTVSNLKEIHIASVTARASIDSSSSGAPAQRSAALLHIDSKSATSSSKQVVAFSLTVDDARFNVTVTRSEGAAVAAAADSVAAVVRVSGGFVAFGTVAVMKCQLSIVSSIKAGAAGSAALIWVPKHSIFSVSTSLTISSPVVTSVSADGGGDLVSISVLQVDAGGQLEWSGGNSDNNLTITSLRMSVASNAVTVTALPRVSIVSLCGDAASPSCFSPAAAAYNSSESVALSSLSLSSWIRVDGASIDLFSANAALETAFPPIDGADDDGNVRGFFSLIRASNQSFAAPTRTSQLDFNSIQITLAPNNRNSVSRFATVFDLSGTATATLENPRRHLDPARLPKVVLVSNSSSWACSAAGIARSSALVYDSAAANSSLSVRDCPPPPRRGIVTDLERAAAAFLSFAILSASAASFVAFGLSRSQEVGEFVAAVGNGHCISPSFAKAPVFSDSPLQLEMPPAWCGYSGGAVISNLALCAVALGVSLLFGLLGCAVRRKAVSIHRVMDYGFFGVTAAIAIGLFLTPTIQHALLCMLRSRDAETHVGVRVLMGAIAGLLFFGVPIWVFVPLMRHKVWLHGKLVPRDDDKAPGCCRATVGRAWDWIFAAQDWTFVMRDDLTDEARGMVAITVKSTGGFMTEKQLRRRFRAWLPLFDEYDDKTPHFFLYETLTNAAMGLIPVITEAFVFSPAVGACWAWASPLILVLAINWVLLVWKRPLQVRLLLLGTVGVSGLQVLMTLLGLYVMTLSSSAPAWAASIDIALLTSQVVVSVIGLLMALKSALRGGWRKLKNCCCPTKEELRETGALRLSDDGDDDDSDDHGLAEPQAPGSGAAAGNVASPSTTNLDSSCLPAQDTGSSAETELLPKYAVKAAAQPRRVDISSSDDDLLGSSASATAPAAKLPPQKAAEAETTTVAMVEL